MTSHGPHEVKITRGARLAASGLLLLTLIVGGGNLLATYLDVHAAQRAQAREQAAARHAGEIVERKLCETFATLARRRPPPGNPRTNPSRAYLQGQYATLNQIGPDLGCHQKEGSR